MQILQFTVRWIFPILFSLNIYASSEDAAKQDADQSGPCRVLKLEHSCLLNFERILAEGLLEVVRNESAPDEFLRELATFYDNFFEFPEPQIEGYYRSLLVDFSQLGISSENILRGASEDIRDGILSVTEMRRSLVELFFGGALVSALRTAGRHESRERIIRTFFEFVEGLRTGLNEAERVVFRRLYLSEIHEYAVARGLSVADHRLCIEAARLLREGGGSTRVFDLDIFSAVRNRRVGLVRLWFTWGRELGPSQRILTPANAWSILHYAAVAGSSRMLHLLEDHGVLRLFNRHGSPLFQPHMYCALPSPIQIAVTHGNLGAVEFFLDHGLGGEIPDGGAFCFHPIHEAARRGYQTILAAFFRRYPWIIHARSINGGTVLHYAAFSMSDSVLLWLLNDRGRNNHDLDLLDAPPEESFRPLNPNILDDTGMSPLHIAARNQSPRALSMIESLLRAEADPMIRDRNGRTPFESAIEAFNYPVLLTLADAMEPAWFETVGLSALESLARSAQRRVPQEVRNRFWACMRRSIRSFRFRLRESRRLEGRRDEVVGSRRANASQASSGIWTSLTPSSPSSSMSLSAGFLGGGGSFSK